MNPQGGTYAREVYPWRRSQYERRDPNVLKTLPVGRAFLIEGTGKRAFVDLCPPQRSSGEPGALLAPPPSRREDGPILDLPRLVAEERGRRAEENERTAADKDNDKDKAKKPDEENTDPGAAPVTEVASVEEEPSGEEAPVSAINAETSPKPEKRRIERPARKTRTPGRSSS